MSKSTARPCNVEWIRSIVGQCKAAGIPAFVKQLGRVITVRNDRHSEWPREGDGLIVPEEYMPSFQGEEHEVRLVDSKGGGPAEWPADLRVRVMPARAEG